MQSISLEKGSSLARTPQPLCSLPFTKTPPKQNDRPKTQAEQTMVSAIQAGRRAALTKAEIEEAPETAATWAAVGRA